MSYSTIMLAPTRSSPSIHSQRSSIYATMNDTSNSEDPTSSSESLGQDDENVTITSSNQRQPSTSKGKSQENLHHLAITTNITELSYNVSDIQTRIFEIQELRHKSQSADDTSGTTNVIDQSLMALDERLEFITKGMKALSEALQALTASPADAAKPDNVTLIRKHSALVADWEAVQDESDVLREELKEDKWLTVFRTVTEQADGMMSSLEKAVNRCQDFIWQIHRQAPESMSASLSSQVELSPLNLETYNTLLESFEAKKKHYMPATSKVLSIIDKGVQDRVTKNGETLRRHAESAKRWRNLRDRIGRTDVEMATVRKILVGTETHNDGASSSTNLSAASTKNGYLTPPSAVNGGPSRSQQGAKSSRSNSRAPSSASTMSRSMSPLRNLARRMVGKSPNPSTGSKSSSDSTRTTAVSEPAKKPKRTSIFSIGGSQPKTPERPTHNHSHSLMPEWSPQSAKTDELHSTIKPKSALKQRWNSSTKVESTHEPADPGMTVKHHTPSRKPSVAGFYNDIPPVPQIAAQYRSVSRSSMGSSRPWTPLTSSGSTAPTSQLSSTTSQTRPSQAQVQPHIPPRSYTPTTPRVPKTPSHIPVPKRPSSPLSDMGWDDCDIDPHNLMGGAYSPENSTGANGVSGLPSTHSKVNGNGSTTPNASQQHHARPPSRSMIPTITPTRPGSSMSHARPESRLANPRGSYMRAQTPESSMIARTKLIPFFTGGVSPRSTGRPSLAKLPPSSYRDTSATRTPSRPSSRAGAATPGFDRENHQQYIYTPASTKDPLDNEVALIVNGISHGLLIERVDPPLRTTPKAGVEVHGQYAFSNSLARKVVTCRLTTMTRSGVKMDGKTVTTKKVMVRVGGGWQDLHIYMLNRQAGM